MAKDKSVIDVEQSKSKGTASTSTHKNIFARLGKLENLTTAVLWLGVITLIGVVVGLGAIVVDNLHFNNETYDNYKNEQGIVQNELTNDTNRISQLQGEINGLKACKSSNTNSC